MDTQSILTATEAMDHTTGVTPKDIPTVTMGTAIIVTMTMDMAITAPRGSSRPTVTARSGTARSIPQAWE
jgi:hypothetical protein